MVKNQTTTSASLAGHVLYVGGRDWSASGALQCRGAVARRNVAFHQLRRLKWLLMQRWRTTQVGWLVGRLECPLQHATCIKCWRRRFIAANATWSGFVFLGATYFTPYTWRLSAQSARVLSGCNILRICLCICVCVAVFSSFSHFAAHFSAYLTPTLLHSFGLSYSNDSVGIRCLPHCLYFI